MLSLAPNTVSPIGISVPVLKLGLGLFEYSEPVEVALDNDAPPEADCPDVSFLAALPPGDKGADGPAPAGAMFWNIERTGKTKDADVEAEAEGESGPGVHDEVEL